jgi:hypothetical protein
MTHYLIGLVVGATGALIGVYCAAALLPATREERPRDPLPGRRDPFLKPIDSATFGVRHAEFQGIGSDDTWTSGPIT